jgi:PAS domain S-box-containing protein
MKLNSIVFKMMTPLVIVTILVISVTFFVTHTYLKKVIDNVFIDLQVHHLEELYSLRIQNILLEIKSAGVAITSSKDVQNFALSEDAANGKISQEMKQKLSDIKKLYKLDTIYIVHTNSKNYFNENGFIRAIDPLNKDNGWFLKTLESKKNFLINTDSDLAGNLYVWLDAVVGSADNPVALAGGGVDISSIFKIALEDFRKNNANVSIIKGTNLVHASSKKHNLLNVPLRESGFSKEKISAIEDAAQRGRNLVEYMVEGKLRNLLFIPIKKLEWNIIIDFSKEEFLDSLSGVHDRIIAGSAILLFLLLFIGSLTFVYLVSKPLKKISLAVNEFDHRTDFELKDCKNMGCEFDMICNAFEKSSALLKKTLDEYRYNEELLKSIINAADDSIFYKDTKNTYLGGNIAYERWNSKSIEEIIGKTDTELYPAEIADYHIQTDRQVIEQKRTILVEERFQKNDGSFIILQIKKGPFYDKNGNVKGVVVVARDMTMIKEMEQALLTLNTTLEKRVEAKTLELQSANETLAGHIVNLEIVNSKLYKAKAEALQAAQARSNFLTGMSHELRTPLNAIINFTDQIIEDFDEMLQNKELQDDTKQFMQRVLINSRHLLNLINDLLEFTKAEAGKIDYKIEKYDLNIIAKMAYNNTYSLLNGSGVKFNLKLNETPLMGMVDSRRFLQILLNLLSNAIKFTQKGAIELRSFEKNAHAIIEVEDSGKGIPQEKQGIIFEPFMQVSNTDNGTGLGLGLVKRMCDDMDIKISFSSVEGEGTVFRLTVKKSLDV